MVLGVVTLLVEEVLWAWLSRMMAALARQPAVKRLEDMIAALPPYGAMLAFLLPVAMILPFKLLAVYLMAKGHVLSGLAVLLAAKITGMALWTRLYLLCRPALISLGWFAWLESTILRWRAWAHDLLEQWDAWRRLREGVRQGVGRLRQWFSLAR